MLNREHCNVEPQNKDGFEIQTVNFTLTGMHLHYSVDRYTGKEAKYQLLPCALPGLNQQLML